MQMPFINNRNIGHRSAIFAAILVVASQLLSCATPAPAPELTPEQRARQENAVGIELATQLEKKLQIERAPEVTSYLRDLCMTLKSGAPELKEVPLGVMVIRDRDKRWRSYGLPGVRIYLSAGAIKSANYENELAAAAALELGLVRTKAVLDNLRKQLPSGGSEIAQIDSSRKPVDFFGEHGVLSFSEDQLLSAIPSAIEVLYHAGYDLRGMVTLLARFEEDPAVSPYPPSVVPKLLEKTREVIAQYAPLRNPIVRSGRFTTVRKRIRKL